MKNIPVKIFYIVLLMSCDKTETVDLLTGGTWILDNGSITAMKESLAFNIDQTYILESRVSIPGQGDYISGIITGDWSRQDDEIIFVNSLVYLPDDTVSILVIPNTSEAPLGAFYGYVVNGIFQNDSSLIDGSGSIRFNDINNSDIFSGLDTNPRRWTILKLTKDSLIVVSDRNVLKYYNE